VSTSTYVMMASFLVAGVIYACACRDISRELREFDLQSSEEPSVATPTEGAQRAAGPTDHP
jgi:hypothetical protein